MHEFPHLRSLSRSNATKSRLKRTTTQEMLQIAQSRVQTLSNEEQKKTHRRDYDERQIQKRISLSCDRVRGDVPEQIDIRLSVSGRTDGFVEPWPNERRDK